LQVQALSSRRFQRGFDRVNLQRPTQAGQVVTGLLPVERVLYGLPHLVDAVEADGDDDGGDEGDPVERGGEHQGRGEHEEEEDELQHVQVAERDVAAQVGIESNV